LDHCEDDLRPAPTPVVVDGGSLWRDGVQRGIGGEQAWACNADASVIVQDSETILTLTGDMAAGGASGEGGQGSPPDQFVAEATVSGLFGAAVAGWAFVNIVAVSDDGKVVAGNGLHAGNAEGWVARLP